MSQHLHRKSQARAIALSASTNQAGKQTVVKLLLVASATLMAVQAAWLTHLVVGFAHH